MPNFNFSVAVLRWFDQHGRHTLPWQQNINAYRVWLSEIMLQQTQVSTVIPYFETFTQQFPTLADLAAAPIDDVLHLWTGLGYYARARNLHKCAQTVMAERHGEFPQDLDSLCSLPGIGRSTAGAIASITWNKPTAILDGNVKRVLARCYSVAGWPGDSAVNKQLWQLTEKLTPSVNTGAYTQAIMDLGATVCTRTRPLCHACPLESHCLARAQGNPQDFPGKKARKALPVKPVQMLMLQNPAGEFLLEQRPPQGIWGGLWSFPELKSGDDPIVFSADHFGPTQTSETWSTYRHTFSHYHLDITPVWLRLSRARQQVMADNRFIWYNSRQPARIGLAAPVKRLLSQLAAITET